jgi:threonine/homoserine/homoserine lactone efflux protein
MWGVIAFAFGMAFSPGPNTTVAFSTGLNYGFLSVVPFTFGVSVGVPLVVAAVAWGLWEFFSVFPSFYDYLRYAGMAYILYLSWKIAAAPVREDNAGAKLDAPGRRLTFLNGLLFQWVNPKVWLLAVTSVATYVGMDLQPAKLLFVCAAFSVLCILSMITWTLGGKLSGRLIRSPRALRAMNLLMGLLLASSVLTLL